MKEHYIEKVISVEDYKIKETYASNFDFVKVKMLISLCDKIKEHEKVFNIEEWELAQEHGYYLD